MQYASHSVSDFRHVERHSSWVNMVKKYIILDIYGQQWNITWLPKGIDTSPRKWWILLKCGMPVLQPFEHGQWACRRIGIKVSYQPLCKVADTTL